jgi:hypothetical protein
MLLLIIISFSTCSSIDLYTSNKYVVEFSCEENKELCGHCSADLIYKVEDKVLFEIEGHLSTTIEIVKDLIKDLQGFLQADEWFLSLDSQNFCLNLKEIESEDFPGLLKTFLDIEYSDYRLPEIEKNSELKQVFVITETGASSNYLTSSIKIDYSLSSSFLVADQVDLKGKEKRLDLFHGQGVTFYSGVAETSVLSPNFFLNFPYGTEPDKVEVLIETKSEVLLSSWYNSTYSNAGCENVPSPTGLDSVHQLPVNKSFLIFKVSSTLTLESFSSQVFPPDFSTYPGIFLYDVEALMTVSGKCGLLVQAFWENEKIWNVSLYAQENQEFYLNARLFNAPFELEMMEFSEILESFYVNFSGIFPQYLNDSQVLEKINELVLQSPLVVIGFNPEANVEMTSAAKLEDSGDVEVFLNTFRRNSVVQTVGEIKTRKVYELFGISQLSDNEFHLDSVNLALDGVNLNVNVSMSLNCRNSAVCLAVENSLNDSVLTNLTGIYLPEDFLVIQDVESVEIVGLEIDSAQVLINFTENSVNLNGSVFINLGAQKLTLYECFVYSDQELAKFYGVQDKEFKGMMGCGNLFLFYSEFLQGATFEDIVYDQVFGICGFKGIEERWTGDLTLELTGYETERYACSLKYAPINTVVKYLAGMTDPDSLISYLDFPYGITLSYEEDFTIEEPLTILGSPSKSFLKTLYLPNTLKFSLTLHDFSTAHGNINLSSISGSLEIYSSYSQASFFSLINLWSISQESTLFISSSSLSFSLTGYPFKGIYSTILSVSADLSTFDLAEWKVKFSISSSYIESLSSSVNSSLENWVLEGQSTLEKGRILVNSWKDLMISSSEDLCDETCGSHFYCTSKWEEKCTEKAKVYNCSEEIPSCNAEVTCKSYKKSCLDEECSSSVYYCEEYLETCRYSNNTQCISESLIEIGPECLNYEYLCDSQSFPEESCRSKCNFYSDINSYYNRCFEMVNSSYYESLENMEGFLQMSGELFEIFQIFGEIPLNQSGLGPGDIQLLVEFRFWKDGSFENISELINWDFFDDRSNAETLLKVIKSSIVKNSHSLTDELVNKTPAEVYSESLSQVE